MKENNEILNQFIIDTVLVNPVNEIVTKLQERSFRDCDIKWLDGKLEKFTSFTAETLGLKLDPVSRSESFTHFNDVVTDKYIFYFTTLLNYFKSI